MRNTVDERGVFKLTEASTPAVAGVAERIQSVLSRIEDRPGDAPVVVSAGFLRWIAVAQSEVENDAETASLRNQIRVLIQERDDAREEANRLKAYRESLLTQLDLTDWRVNSLTERMTKLHGLSVSLSGKR